MLICVSLERFLIYCGSMNNSLDKEDNIKNNPKHKLLRELLILKSNTLLAFPTIRIWFLIIINIKIIEVTVNWCIQTIYFSPSPLIITLFKKFYKLFEFKTRVKIIGVFIRSPKSGLKEVSTPLPWTLMGSIQPLSTISNQKRISLEEES